MNATVYNKEGKETSQVNLPAVIFGQAWNANLVHQVVVSILGNARSGTAHTKDRSEVRGGGRKPWRQKGTSRARHGSNRSPIWVGGGVTFGPRIDKNYHRKLNKTVRRKALASTLSKKYANGKIIFVDDFAFAEPKAAVAKSTLKALSAVKGAEDIDTRKRRAALIVLPKRDENTEKSFRNFGNVSVEQVKDINPAQILSYKYLVVVEPEVAFKILTERVGSKTAVDNKTTQ